MPVKQLSMLLKHKALRIAHWALYSLSYFGPPLHLPLSWPRVGSHPCPPHACLPDCAFLLLLSVWNACSRRPPALLPQPSGGSVIEVHLPWAPFFKQQLFPWHILTLLIFLPYFSPLCLFWSKSSKGGEREFNSIVNLLNQTLKTLSL